MSNIKKDSLGDRMKTYEAVPKLFLMRRNPVIIRLDMKAGHTFTKGFKKPFDRIFMSAMQDTAKYLCENIQGCKLAYTQSDEISLLLTDYERIETCAWFDYNLEKIVSVSASLATLAFNKAFRKYFEIWFDCYIETDHTAEDEKLNHSYMRSEENGAVFDSRAFSIPKEDVCNYFIWRQQDAIRNSIQAVGQANFSEKQLHKKNTKDIRDMLIKEKNIDWLNFRIDERLGSCVIKVSKKVETENGIVDRNVWINDYTIPIFSEYRNYIEALI